MPRERLRTAITGPVAVAGGAIAPRLVHRILNDLGDDHDQLPLVQHALSRTWARWAGVGGGAGQIDVEDYEAVGTIRHALSTHAEEAYDEATAQGLARTTERVFKALTDTVTDARGTRRPTSVASLAAIAEASEHDVVRVVDIFRASGRCFLMPPASTPLEAGSIVDLSHESLMRCWGRLITWAEEERAAATFYARLSQAAAWFEEGTAGLWRNPELVLAERWRATTAPSAAWAARYDAGFDRAIAFLDSSLAERDRQARAAEVERRAKLRRTQLVAGVLALLLLVSTVLGVLAMRERDRAAENLALARRAVDQSLAVVDRDAAKIGADLPQVMALRRELLAKAKAFSDEFIARDPGNRESRRELALAHLRLGHIDRMLDRADQAEQQYRQAISQLSALVSETGDAADRQFLASAYNWLGETLRGQAGRAEQAADAYNGALELQSALAEANPSVEAYQQEFGRTLYNRGILRSDIGQPSGAEEDFREAIRRLEPLTGETARQDLGRAYNNLAALYDMQGRAEARTYYERAIATYEKLVADHPANMEYQGELALLSNNLAYRLHALGATAEALVHSQRAVDLLTTLAQPPPSLAIDRADAHTLRGTILEAVSAARATEAYAEAIRHFENLGASTAAIRIPNFHVRFGELLVNLAILAKGRTASERSRQLLARGLDEYSRVASTIARSGSAGEIREALATVESVRSNLGDAEGRRLLALEEDLRGALRERGAPQESSRL
jgi:tetratricopeptide (TPR) repeat protein